MPPTWQELLHEIRYTTSSTRPVKHETSLVTSFQEDARRVLHSSYFRRLQGKTQVYPFPRYDYLRTRLTHTIEVADVGRIIARLVSRAIVEKDDDVPEGFDNISDIVYAACLCHDLGNPPFGHTGEAAIRQWFEERMDDKSSPLHEMSDEQKNDFRNFDGNAQGFRIITRLSGWREQGGLCLTYPVTAAFVKYPFSSSAATDKKKCGWFSADTDAANTIFKGLNLIDSTSGKFIRHPLAYIVEAADDICYLTSDIDDACRIKKLDPVKAARYLEPIARARRHAPDIDNFNTKDSPAQDIVSYLRAGAQSSLIDLVAEKFVQERKSLRNGTFGADLISATNMASEANGIRDYCKENIYLKKDKLRVEQAGIHAIAYVLELFGQMVIDYYQNGEKNLKPRNHGLYHLLPTEFQKRLSTTDIHTSMLVLLDYVSGMTDRYILEMYQNFSASNYSLGRMK